MTLTNPQGFQSRRETLRDGVFQDVTNYAILKLLDQIEKRLDHVESHFKVLKEKQRNNEKDLPD